MMRSALPRNQDTLGWLYGLVFFAYILSWPISRNLGTAGYAILLVAALGAIAGRRGLFDNMPLLLIAPLAAFYAILSVWDIMPRAWTLMHDNSVIVQQSLGYLTLPLFVAANLRLIQLAAALSRRTHMRLAIAYLFACFLITPFLLTSDQSADISSGAGIIEFVMLNTFFSSELLLIALLGYIIFRLPLSLALVVGVLLLGISTNVQPVLAILLALAYRFGLIKERGTLMIVVSLLFACLISTQFVEPLFNLDINTGIRAAFWQGSLEALARTWGVGVGFATEAIRSGYFFRLGDWLVGQDATDYLLIGMHNSFFNIAFRLGVIGLWLLAAAMNRIRPRRAQGPFHNWLFVLTILDLCVNVTIESASFDLGFSFLIALIIYLNQTASKRLSRNVLSVPAERVHLDVAHR